MHNFVYLAQKRSQEFSCEPNFGGGGVPTEPSPLGCASASGGNNINDFPEDQLTKFLVFSPLRHTGMIVLRK